MILRNEKGRVIGIRVIFNGISYDVDDRLITSVGYRRAMPASVLAMAAGEAFHDPEARAFMNHLETEVRQK